MKINSSKPSVVSWSGGKDSALALYKARRSGLEIKTLFNMLDETGQRSRSHGLAPFLLERQAKAMGAPILFGRASWENYEREFVASMRDLSARGVKAGVFGDIDVAPNREWEEKVCSAAGLEPFLPLWGKGREELIHEFLALGFKAIIVTVRAERLGKDFLGRALDYDVLDEFAALGVDLCGEEGEYHTFVYDGPIFDEPVEFRQGRVERNSGCFSLDLS